jgi:hypothetical protein
VLTPEQAQQVQIVLSMGGWNGVMRPALLTRRDNAVRALALSPTERMAKLKDTGFDLTDEDLRAIIREDEWLVKIWEMEIAAYHHNRERDELDALNNGVGANP